jgi:hypothetical protein
MLIWRPTRNLSNRVKRVQEVVSESAQPKSIRRKNVAVVEVEIPESVVSIASVRSRGLVRDRNTRKVGRKANIDIAQKMIEINKNTYLISHLSKFSSLDDILSMVPISLSVFLVFLSSLHMRLVRRVCPAAGC